MSCCFKDQLALWNVTCCDLKHNECRGGATETLRAGRNMDGVETIDHHSRRSEMHKGTTRRAGRMAPTRTRRLRIIAASGSLLISGLLVVSVEPSVAAAPRPAADQSVTETSAINRIADQINTVGITDYPGSFASATLTSATTVTVYATANDAALLTAIAAIPKDGVHVVVRTVAHSSKQLNALAVRIGRDNAALKSENVHVSTVAIDAAAGILRVTLVKPTGVVPSSAVASLVSGAQRYLDHRYGAAWISVQNATEPLARTSAERDRDGSPFTGGDQIQLTGIGETCTLGFTTKGNNSGNEYLLTAGHCGTGTVTAETNDARIGTVSTQYLGGAHDYDVDTIRANGRPRVWYGDDFTTSYYTVTGSVVPANLSLVTIDGDKNPPQHTGNTVTNNDTYGYFSTHWGDVYIGPLVELNTAACIAGDSGGPAYVRLGGSGNVSAVGTITGINGSHCFVYWISSALGAANLSLVTG
jgi:hypothetical protein